MVLVRAALWQVVAAVATAVVAAAATRAVVHLLGRTTPEQPQLATVLCLEAPASVSAHEDNYEFASCGSLLAGNTLVA